MQQKNKKGDTTTRVYLRKNASRWRNLIHKYREANKGNVWKFKKRSFKQNTYHNGASAVDYISSRRGLGVDGVDGGQKQFLL